MASRDWRELSDIIEFELGKQFLGRCFGETLPARRHLEQCAAPMGKGLLLVRERDGIIAAPADI
jgi:hypothetical protein